MALLAMGFAAGMRWEQRGAGAPAFREERETGHTFISPLLDCDDWAPSRIPELRALQRSVEDIAEAAVARRDVAQVSVYFRDLQSGPWAGLNEHAKFSPASLLKVPALLAALRAAEKNPRLLSQEIVFQGTNNSLDQNMRPEQSLEVGHAYAFEEILRRMIVYSDNASADIVRAFVGQEAIEMVLQDLGIDKNSLEADDSVSVKEYASVFRRLYNASLLGREMSERALSMLTRSSFTEGLRAGVPGDTPVAHKFGERITNSHHQMHDCGIVYFPKQPYLLCVMTRGGDFKAMARTISQVSRTVHESYAKYLSESDAPMAAR